MDFKEIKERIFRCYDEVSGGGLFKISSCTEKFKVFFLPYIILVVFTAGSIVGYMYNCYCLIVISVLILIVSPFYFNEIYINHRKKKFSIPYSSNDDTNYHLFVNKLKENNIKYKDITSTIDVMMLDNDRTKIGETNVFKYLTLIFIPFFGSYLLKEYNIILEMIIILFFGILFVPALIFICKCIFNRKNNKKYIILHYLKRISIEFKFKFEKLPSDLEEKEISLDETKEK